MPAPKKDDGSYDVKSINERLKKLENKLADKKAARSDKRTAASERRSAANEKAKSKRAAGNKVIKASGAS